MYFDRDRIQTEGESQTEGVVEKTEELTDMVTKFLGRTRAVQTRQGAAAEEVVQTVRNSIQLLCRLYGFLTIDV